MASVCQRCHQPLRLDASLQSQSAYDMIASSLPDQTSQPVASTSSSPLARLPASLQSASANRSGHAASRKVIPAPPGRQGGKAWPPSSNPEQSYVLLTESQIRPPAAVTETAPGPRSLSKDLARAHALFDLVSSHSDIDHPLCTECGAVLASIMDRQLADAKKERDRYLAYERDFANTSSKGKAKADVEAVEADIKRLEAEEARMAKELEEAQTTSAKLDAELAALQQEEKELEAEEQQFWLDHARFISARDRLKDQLKSVETRYERDKKELERLQKANVYNDAFHITFHDNLGCINGLRFGKPAKTPLEWPEFNAAWGNIVLLLSVIARRLDYVFKTYRLIPMASFSRLENIVSKTSYNLFGSGDLALGSFLHVRRLNEGMVAFLDCLKQVTEVASARDPTLRFPYAINKDKIGDKSIKQPQLYDDSEWTEALTRVLITLKALLARFLLPPLLARRAFRDALGVSASQWDLVRVPAHFLVNRTQGARALGTTVLMFLLSALAATSIIMHPAVDPAAIRVTRLDVQMGRIPYDRHRERPYAFTRFDLQADLRPLFNWNTKQLFVYLLAEYNTAQYPDNQVVIWDRIIRRKQDARINLSEGRNKYSFKEITDSFDNVTATFSLQYNRMPYVGVLQYGQAGSAMPIPFPAASRRQ